MDKYYKFESFLKTKIDYKFELSFEEIEHISGVKLPNSAYNYCAYWYPNGHIFAKSVALLGYKMKPDLINKTVLFIRNEGFDLSLLENKFDKKPKQKTKINYNYKINEQEFLKYVDKFIYIYDHDANSRYMSYDHIRNAFMRYKDMESSRDIITLNLYAYLASWGMLRNSFLMQKDYKFSRPVVDVLCSKKYEVLMNYNPFHDNGSEKLNLMDELVRDIKKCYIGKTYYDEGDLKPKVIDNVTDTLVSKIILGTLGCTVAYDRYVRSGLTYHKLSKNCSYNSFEQLRAFAKDNESLITKALSKLTDIYTPMKVLDMYFFEFGFEHENKL